MRMSSKLSDISERPVMRPLRVTFATCPLMIAPRNWSGEFTVMVKRSPTLAVFVEKSISGLAFSICPVGHYEAAVRSGVPSAGPSVAGVRLPVDVPPCGVGRAVVNSRHRDGVRAEVFVLSLAHNAQTPPALYTELSHVLNYLKFRCGLVTPDADYRGDIPSVSQM